MTEGVPFREIKHKLTGEQVEFPCEALDRSPSHVVVRYIIQRTTQVADIVLSPGMVTYGFYWTTRPYNVYHWVGDDRQIVADYVNLADQVVIRADAVEWRDLALDLLLLPDGRVQILDAEDLRIAPAGLRATVEALSTQVLGSRHEIIDEVAAVTRRLHKPSG